MRQVKLFLSEERYTDWDDSHAELGKGVTDWETLSDEDYSFLKNNLWLLRNQLNVNVILVEKDCVPVVQRIASIREWVKQQQAKIDEEKARKRAQAQEREKKKLLKKAESEIKLLEELKAKYPNAGQ